MKILLTGATGFIGKEFIRLLQNYYEIIALVRDSSDILVLKNTNCKIVIFSDYKEINDIFINNNIDGVVHFASNIVIEHKLSDIEYLIDSNITFGTYLLEACKCTNVKWFINTGTFWQNFESDRYNPVNLYAASKEAFENIAKYYTETSNLIFTTIKLNDTFGINDTRNKIFNLWYQISQNGESLNMSEGEQIIDISYIEDIINAYKILIEHLNLDNKYDFNNEIFVVTNNEKVSLKELSKIFEDVTSSKLNINWGERYYREREVMMPYSVGKIVPNWNQKYSLRQAIQKTIKDMKND